MKKYHYGNGNTIIYSIGNNIFVENKDLVYKLHINNILQDTFSLIKRATRSDIHNVNLCGNTLIVVIKGKLLFFKSKKFVKELIIDRGKRPLRSGVLCLENQLFYGDYWVNPERMETNIYRIDLKTLNKEIYFSFKHVQHIHFIQKDNFITDSLLVGTGDSDSESGIYQLDIKSKKIKVILEGSQNFRLVSIIQFKEYLIWGTDAPDNENYIYRYNRKTEELECLKKINGPAYYSTITKKGYMYIATTVEDRQKHEAIIYESKDSGSTWNTFKKFKKDIWNCVYFGYGIVEFIKGQEYYDELIYNQTGLIENKRSN